MSTQVRCITCEEAEIHQSIRRLNAAAEEVEKLQAEIDKTIQEVADLAKEKGVPPPLHVDLDAMHKKNAALLEEKKLEIGKLEQALLILQKWKS
ncbi:hypothetical protein EV361DRAFT_955500 [Lentinula raphanica]|nr:hypothetical protein C8R42DRAFT_717408 [Lentinula raphanica]KAJ3964889.1 hypothetical protein EV361DRAFT_955530 [Lentinula raphanica]KAJ3964916.1 hypothetical protein EV361DRAFT_955500 [Lentinula raphanica]